MIMLSRNTPISFVVGAAGFIGSSVSEKLLAKGIQVVGIDDLSTGQKENLLAATREKNFHFFNQSVAQDLNLQLPRLDYAFFIISENTPPSVFALSFASFLSLCRKFKSKIVLVSSINLYDREFEGLSGLRSAEKELAHQAALNKLNARVVRLTAVYGPRMHFRENDPMIKLIEAAAKDELQKETTPLDFTSRSLFIADAVNLLIKAVMHGGSARKIYDGALLNPLKVTEIKQVLLDPLWHEQRGFAPTELPPWPTPNLVKTAKELLWKPSVSPVAGLKQTLHYLKQNPGSLPKTTEITAQVSAEPVLKQEKDKEPEGKRESEKVVSIREWLGEKKDQQIIPKGLPEKSEKLRKNLAFLIGTALMLYAFIFPALEFVWNLSVMGQSWQNTTRLVQAGELNRAYQEAQKGSTASKNFKQIISSFGYLKSLPPLTGEFEQIEEMSNLLYDSQEAIEQAALGSKLLSEGVQGLSGGSVGTGGTLADAFLALGSSNRQLAAISARLSDQSYRQSWPGFSLGLLSNWHDLILSYQKKVALINTFTRLLPQAVPAQGRMLYLVVLEDNTRLRPAGGTIQALAEISFEGGKLVNIESGPIQPISQKLTEHVEPPAEIKTDWQLSDWTIKDANFEVDFPSSARWLQWFYNRVSKEKAAGVIALDLDGLTGLLEVVGPINLPSTSQTFSYTNIKEMAFRGQFNDEAAGMVLKETLKRLFFLERYNYLKILQNLETALKEKHLMVYFSSPALFAYSLSEGWTGMVPRQAVDRAGERNEFLAIAESNLGESRQNDVLKRSFKVESTLLPDQQFVHKLTVRYFNQGRKESYRARVKVYLPAGSKLTGARWAEQEIIKDVKSFSDYGRAGYSLVVGAGPGQEKELILEYEDLKSVVFDQNKLKLRLNVFKQPGTGSDKFDFKLFLPAGYKAAQTVFASNLSTDRLFEVEVEKISQM